MKVQPKYLRFIYSPEKAEKKLEDTLNSYARDGYNIHSMLQTSQGIMFIFEYDVSRTYMKYTEAVLTISEIAEAEESEGKRIANEYIKEGAPREKEKCGKS
jgi:hypothetical protein